MTTIDAGQLKIEELRLKYLDLIERPEVFPTKANWDYIVKSRMHGLARPLYAKYLKALKVDENDRDLLHDTAIEEFPKYLASIDRQEAIDAVYSDLLTATDEAISLIRENSLFDAVKILGLIDNRRPDIALSVIDVYQPSYTEEDLEPMERLENRIDSFPELGTIERRTGIFGVSERYICPDGHSNPSDEEFCQHTGCGKNSRGLTAPQERAVKTFSHRLKALKSLFKEV